MSEFHVGEIAIYVRPGSPYYGREITVTSCLLIGSVFNVLTNSIEYVWEHYLIDGLPQIDGRPWCSKPEWLRKKQQKRDIDQLVSWDDFQNATGWSPKRQTA